MKRKAILTTLEEMGVEPPFMATTGELRDILTETKAETIQHSPLRPVAKPGKRLGKYGGNS